MKPLVFFCVFLGGGLGSMLRFMLSYWFNESHRFIPLGTLSANVLSCMLLGFVGFYFQNMIQSHIYRHFILVGFCGGFSTFSTFSNENFKLIQSGNYIAASVYTVGSLLLGLLGLFLGWAFAKWIF